MNRTIFLVDGFNLYFSVREASRQLRGAQTKWLDIYSLCKSFMYIVGRSTGQRAELESVYYFSAIARHLRRNDPSKIQRQQAYLDCLIDSGIQVELGKFQRKQIRCKQCGKTSVHYEEKETDVAIGARLIEVLVSNKCDTAVLMTGDTDLASAVRIAQQLRPDKTIMFAFPYKRESIELKKSFPTFTISEHNYVTHQFPSTVTMKNGNVIHKPARW